MAHSDCGWTCGCAVKTVKSLENTCHTWALLRWWFTTKRRYINCIHLYLYLYQGCVDYVENFPLIYSLIVLQNLVVIRQAVQPYVRRSVEEMGPSCSAFQGHSKSSEPKLINWLPMTSCQWSMGLYRTASEINGVFGRKFQIFPRPSLFITPRKGVFWNSVTAVVLKEKLERCPYWKIENAWRYVHSLRHNTSDFRTDGQTDSDNRISRCMGKPHSAWRTTVNSLPLPVAVNYGHLTPSHV